MCGKLKLVSSVELEQDFSEFFTGNIIIRDLSQHQEDDWRTTVPVHSALFITRSQANAVSQATYEQQQLHDSELQAAKTVLVGIGDGRVKLI